MLTMFPSTLISLQLCLLSLRRRSKRAGLCDYGWTEKYEITTIPTHTYDFVFACVNLFVFIFLALVCSCCRPELRVHNEKRATRSSLSCSQSLVRSPILRSLSLSLSLSLSHPFS